MFSEEMRDLDKASGFDYFSFGSGVFSIPSCRGWLVMEL